VDNTPTNAGANTIPVRPNRLLTTVFAVPRIRVGNNSLVMVAEIAHTAFMPNTTM
jgi:hypothetical protein